MRQPGVLYLAVLLLLAGGCRLAEPVLSSQPVPLRPSLEEAAPAPARRATAAPVGGARPGAPLPAARRPARARGRAPGSRPRALALLAPVGSAPVSRPGYVRPANQPPRGKADWSIILAGVLGSLLLLGLGALSVFGALSWGLPVSALLWLLALLFALGEVALLYALVFSARYF